MNKPSKIITIVISAIVVGGGGILGFTMYITDGDVKKSIWASITAMVLTGLTGLISSIWQELEERLKIYASNSIELWFKNNLSGKKRKYLEYIIEKYRFYDMRGRQQSDIPHDLAFDDLFVEPTLSAYQNASNNDGISIWKLFQQEKKMEIQGGSYVVLGDAGSGKTTLIKYIALRLAKNNQKFIIKSRPEHIPVVLHLLQIKKQVYNNPSTTLSEVIEAQYKNEIRVSSDWLRKKLLIGKCAVLLDGVDEIADTNVRIEVIKWIQEQIRVYRKSIFIITSRPGGYLINPLLGVKVFEIQPFVERQINEYIKRWYQAYEIQRSSSDEFSLEGAKQRATNNAAKLIHILDSRKELKHLAGIPLLLSMIASVYSAKLNLPGRRYELYNDIITVSLERYYRGVDINAEVSLEEDGKDPLKMKQKRELLEIVAHYMMEQEITEIDESILHNKISWKLNRFNKEYSPEEFIKLIKEKSGLLTTTKEKTYSFAHKTFQEYLASTHILNDQTEGLRKKLRDQIGKSWWNETILLYVAQTDATPFVDKLIDLNIPTKEKLLLAKKILEDASEIDPDKEEKIRLFLETLSKDTEIYQHYLLAETNLTSRIRTDFLNQVDKYIYIDNSLITIREYLLFINESIKKERYHYPDQWKHTNLENVDLDAPITGLRPADAILFIKWLTEWDLNPTLYRLPSIIDIEKAKRKNLDIINTNRYWLYNQNQKLISTTEPTKASKVISSNTVIRLFEDDIKRLDEIFEAFMKRGTPPKKTSTILDESHFIGFGSGSQEKHVGSVELILRKEADRAFHGRRLLEKSEFFSNLLHIDFSNRLTAIHKYLLSSGKTLSDHLIEFPLNPAYDNSSYDLGNLCTNTIAIIQDPNTKRVLPIEKGSIADILSEALISIRDRTWSSFTFDNKSDNEEFYYFLRWLVRISTLCIRSFIVETSKTPYHLNAQYHIKDVTKEMLIGMIELEDRIEGNLSQLEGLLLVKEVKG